MKTTRPVCTQALLWLCLASPAAYADSATTTHLSLATALALAFLGGVTLNGMPCVFPVLSFKALALLKQGQQATRQIRLHGLAYTLGILTSFAALGTLLAVLRAGGSEVGWGFQFQSPLFVLVVTYLMLAVGLSLSGLFTLENSFANLGSSLAARPGYAGSFFTGALATLVATPCTAPFMGAALGYALAQPTPILIAVLLSLGLGLALPYLLLSNWPVLQRRLPQPGEWMVRLRQMLAFPMYASAVWLLWVLARQAGNGAARAALLGMIIIALSAWAYGSTRSRARRQRLLGGVTLSAGLIVALGLGYWGVTTGLAAHASDGAATGPQLASQSWEPYSNARLQALRREGRPVFLNVTAAWCATCQANERLVLSQSSVQQTFRDSGTTYLKGEWTTADHEVTALLARFERDGVPLYVFFPRGSNSTAVILPQILTPAIVRSAIRDGLGEPTGIRN